MEFSLETPYTRPGLDAPVVERAPILTYGTVDAEDPVSFDHFVPTTVEVVPTSDGDYTLSGLAAGSSGKYDGGSAPPTEVVA